MAQPESLLLTDVGDVDHVRNAVDNGEEFLLVAAFEEVFELEADIEVVFDGGFTAARHDNDVLNARMQRLFDAVLNDRLVDDGEHFLGHGLGGWQKTGAQPGGGKNGFANFGRHPLQFRAETRAFATEYLYFDFLCDMYMVPRETYNNGIRNS